MADLQQLTIITAETLGGNVLIHFSNGSFVLFQAQFLWDIREQDGNVATPKQDDNLPIVEKVAEQDATG